MNNNEIRKMEFSIDSRRKGINGFEGCVNYQKGNGCNERGYYLASYSPEGECVECELKSHPERFVGCLFCRRPYKLNSDACSPCSRGFEKWIKEHVSLNGTPLKYLGQVGIRILSIRVNNNRLKLPFIPRAVVRPNSGTRGLYSYEWPGFTTLLVEGVIGWVIPDTLRIEIDEEYTWEDCDESVLRILAKNGIHPYDEVQYIPKV